MSSEEFGDWAQGVKEGVISTRDTVPNTCLEITNTPKKLDGRSLTSLIVTATKLVPVQTDVCVKKDGYGNLEHVTIVEFKTEDDALTATERIKSSPFSKTWRVRIIKNPKIVEPEEEMLSAWLN